MPIYTYSVVYSKLNVRIKVICVINLKLLMYLGKYNIGIWVYMYKKNVNP